MFLQRAALPRAKRARPRAPCKVGAAPLHLPGPRWVPHALMCGRRQPGAAASARADAILDPAVTCSAGHHLACHPLAGAHPLARRLLLTLRGAFWRRAFAQWQWLTVTKTPHGCRPACTQGAAASEQPKRLLTPVWGRAGAPWGRLKRATEARARGREWAAPRRCGPARKGMHQRARDREGAGRIGGRSRQGRARREGRRGPGGRPQRLVSAANLRGAGRTQRRGGARAHPLARPCARPGRAGTRR